MRANEFQVSVEKPAVKYLEWASEQGKLKYYDKSKGENILLDPTELGSFLVLMQFHTVKGWNDKSESAVYSNEVKNISSQELEVRSFKGGLIAKGIYKEIKEQIVAAGGHYVKSIYILVNGEVWNLQLKGAVVQEWGEVFNKCQNRFADEWVTLDKVDKRKKGRVEFTVPVFKFAGVIDDATAKAADAAYDQLTERLKLRDDERNADAPKPVAQLQGDIAQAMHDHMIEAEQGEDDDLPF